GVYRLALRSCTEVPRLRRCARPARCRSAPNVAFVVLAGGRDCPPAWRLGGLRALWNAWPRPTRPHSDVPSGLPGFPRIRVKPCAERLLPVFGCTIGSGAGGALG